MLEETALFNSIVQWKANAPIQASLSLCSLQLSDMFWRFKAVFSARCNIYISRLCYDVSVHLSVRLSVTEVHWRIIANLGFKFRSHFTAHCGRRAACQHEACSTKSSGTMLASARLSCFFSSSRKKRLLRVPLNVLFELLQLLWLYIYCKHISCNGEHFQRGDSRVEQYQRQLTACAETSCANISHVMGTSADSVNGAVE